MLESSCVIDIVDCMADSCFVSEYEIFGESFALGECFTLDYKYEFVDNCCICNDEMDCGEGKIHLFIMWILHQQVVVQPLHAVCAHKKDKS